MSRHDARVLIAGAGPVGLAAALRLNAFSIPCTVIEAAPGLQRDLRASTFHPPTLDMLDDYGLAAPLIGIGRQCPSWQLRIHETHERAEFDLGLLAADTRHPYRLQCEQFRLCELLIERLGRAPHVNLEWSTRVTGLQQDADGVRVDAMTDGCVRQFDGRLLIGADGARSAVRGAVGIEFSGKTYPETTILATTPFPFHDHLPGLSNVNYVWNREGTFSLLRLPVIWRCSLYPDPDESIDDAILPPAIERKLQRIVPGPLPYEVHEVRPYRVHMRIASDYRAGRVVLAGDAAHVNSPSGGMGMNGGIHDAFNLSEKIRDVWEGADLEILDRYTRQRRPVAAEEILVQADRNRARMQERDPVKRRALFNDMQRTAADPELARAFLLRSSMIEGLRRASAQP
ncbi:MAG TPA: NAD(P)/FAD-dependent oxidoreductase [Steroidobacteraceae bacterium]|nr:NAD(P)/FAD-dependent oxidoreductase [Steroidobacteraceae bacterium]